MPEHAAELPLSTDLRDIFPPNNDQRSIGACVSNSYCECLESLERKGQRSTLYSRLALYYWARVDHGVSPSEDSGLEVSWAIETAQKRGVPLESTWSYVDPETRFKIAPPVEAEREAADHKLILAFHCPSLWTIKASLSQGFGLVMGMQLPHAFMSDETARTGRMPFVDGGDWDGGHSLACIGYDDALVLGPDDVGALWLRNSWGASWGREGDVALSYKYVTYGIASDFTSLRRARV